MSNIQPHIAATKTPLVQLHRNPAASSLQAAPKTAVLIPCYNEEAAVSEVVHAFRRALPDARIYVYDNNSRDNTIKVARAAGAIVRTEPLQGLSLRVVGTF